MLFMEVSPLNTENRMRGIITKYNVTVVKAGCIYGYYRALKVSLLNDVHINAVTKHSKMYSRIFTVEYVFLDSFAVLHFGALNSVLQRIILST
jgi:hypothetical protein